MTKLTPVHGNIRLTKDSLIFDPLQSSPENNNVSTHILLNGY
jgi:hypothetical protein